MITQKIFSSIIDSQQLSFKSKSTGIERELLHQVPQASGFASIISGIRRCGKSTLQLQIKKQFFQPEACS
ncbi:MAG: hypothetical protein ACOX0V_01325 [Bacteroidales bacterium]